MKTRVLSQFVAVAAILVAVTTTAIRFVHAGDSYAITQSEASPPPIDIEGCWMGGVFNDGQGNTNISFELVQHGQTIHMGPRVAVGSCAAHCGSSVHIGDNILVFAPIGGMVDSSGFNFRGFFKVKFAVGSATSSHLVRCGITGQGILRNDGTIDGTYVYDGKCTELGFVGGDFSISACN